MRRVSLSFALALAVTGALFSQGAPAVEQVSTASVDELEATMLDRLNSLRARAGLAVLRVSPGLSSAAHYHTMDMARNGSCGHRSANGTSFWKRLSRFYGRGAGWRAWSAAENILCYERPLTAARALGRWLASPAHRENLLSPRWREIGLAAAYAKAVSGEFGGEDTLLVTANFGVRR